MSRFRVALAGAAVLTAAVVGTARSADPLPPLALDAPTPAPLLGFAPAGGYEQSLVRLDPQTLARSGRRFVATGDQNFGWSFSPDRSRLVLGSTSGTLQLVDTRKLRSLGYVDTGVYELVQATQWVGTRQVVAAVGACCGLGPTSRFSASTGTKPASSCSSRAAEYLAAHPPHDARSVNRIRPMSVSTASSSLAFPEL